MADDRGMSPALFQQPTLAIVGHSAEDGLWMITTVRSDLDTWEAFLQDHPVQDDDKRPDIGLEGVVAVECRSLRRSAPRTTTYHRP